ncbi:MAG: thioredoxin domain-containing protein [Chitinophagaceae bacterium]|nr:thioredoxin domain-containing protein [Chitinophagaceae bacterium]
MLNIFSTVSQHNSIAVTQQLLNSLQVPFTFGTIKDSIKQHPDYPSIAAVHDTLKEYKVDNLVLQTGPDKLDELPLPFIAHVKGKSAGFITVTMVTANEITYFKKNSLHDTVTTNRDEFLKNWSGVSLLAEKTEQSGEKDYKANRKKEMWENLRLPFLIATVIILLFFSITNGSTFSYFLLAITLLKLMGVIVTGLLLWYEIDKSNPFLQKVCSGNKASNCNAILQSKEAKLFGIISWSEIGFFYFAGGLLFVIPSLEGSAQILAWLNLLALPYTFFSIYYQWRIAKQWCPLCLAVQALLVLEAVVFFTAEYYKPLISSLPAYYILLTTFLLPVLFWFFVKPYMLQSKEAEEYRKRFYRMKRDGRIFEALLAKQKRVTISTEGLGITLGNPQATNTIVKVCNPYCGPCAKAHPEMHELLHANDDLKVQILFTATAVQTDRRSKPVKHLLAIAEKKDQQLTEQALDDWYLSETKDYEVFASKYPMNGELKKQDGKLEAMNSWYDEVKIEFTPTFFVNGYQLPDNYTITDLKYFLSS